MSGTKTGVYPVYENQFQVGASKESLNNIADMVTFSVALDNGIEEWNPMDQKGWVRRLMTAKSITISISGKRNIGDAGNDFVNGLALNNGREAEACLQWTFQFILSQHNLCSQAAQVATSRIQVYTWRIQYLIHE